MHRPAYRRHTLRRWAAITATVAPMLAALLAAPVAEAAGSATAVTNDGKGGSDRVRIDFDQGRLRVDSDNKSEGYLVTRDDQVYLVSQMGGRPVVMQLNSMISAFGARMQSFVSGTDGVREFVSLTDTRRRETVAGVGGQVFELIYVDGKGVKRRTELALSRDSRAVEMSAAFRGLMLSFQRQAKVTEPAGSAELWARIDRLGMGVLRFADRFEVATLSATAPDPTRFELPAAPMSLPDLGPLKGILGGGARN